ncbi:MAG: bifunctional indole-3-glycerol phosphate synthase/phosphoribosylanthranilate isomerase [Bacillota bacterium]|nr:bifunctional indole-3-glycerol phosphate synthase/phosphoribosylanthranilate isomerase [Bacillota bacterium]
MILDAIVEAKRRELAAAREAPAVATRAAGAGGARPPLSLERALRRRAREGRLGLIAECKRRSPSAGEIAPIPEPARLAERYVEGGAAALSVLTDRTFFGGDPADLRAVRAAVPVPVLRKDFLIDPDQVRESAALGADAVLVIARLFEQPEQLAAMLDEVERAGLEALVEVHDEEEAARVAALGARLVGVNNRDLATFRVERERAERVARFLRAPGQGRPRGALLVAESGYRRPEELLPAAEAGVDAALVGEALVRAGDPARLAAGFAAVRRPGAPAGRERVRVKICGLDSLEATRAAVEAGADAVGWILLPGRRRSVDPEAAAAWAREVPPAVLRVGVFARQAPEEVAALARRCRLDAVQLHGGEDEAYVLRLRSLLPDAELIRAVASPEEARGEADRWLLDPGEGGAGRRAPEEAALGFRARGLRWWLAGGLDPENVAGFLERYRPDGVDVSSGVESGGRKDPGRIRAFVQAVRGWERARHGAA